MKFAGLENKRIIWTVWVNSTGYLLQLCRSSIFLPIFLPSLHPNCFWCWNIQNHMLKNTLYRCWTSRAYTNLTGNFRVCVGVAFLCLLCAFLPSHTTLGVYCQTTFCENKYGVHFFTLNFECHNRYSKFLLCHSENGDIAWSSKNNSKLGFLKKTTKSCLFKKRVFLNSVLSTVDWQH